MKNLTKRVLAGLLVAFLVVAQVSTIPDTAVMGGLNLTTSGAIPYVSAPGVLSQTGGITYGNTERLLTLTGKSGQSQPYLQILTNSGGSVYNITSGGVHFMTPYADNVSSWHLNNAAGAYRVAGGTFSDTTGWLAVYDASQVKIAQLATTSAGGQLITYGTDGYTTGVVFNNEFRAYNGGASTAMRARYGSTGPILGSSALVNWRNQADPSGGSTDLGLARGASALLLIGSGSVAATTSFAGLAWDSTNGFTLKSGAASATWNDASTSASGTVTSRYLFGIAAPTLTATNASVTYTTASTLRIGGAPTASTNVTIGTGYALEVAAGNSLFGGNITSGGNIVGGAGGAIGFVGRGGLWATGDGLFRLQNNGGSGMTGIQLGGTTSSFHYLKLSGTTLQHRLADDSADAPLTASNMTASGDFIGSSTSCIYLGATGTDGSWRWCRSGNNSVMERRESGSWVSKQVVTP